MQKVYVVCEGYCQFEAFCLDNKISPNSPLLCYIPDGDRRQLCGITNPHVEFYGTWLNRRDRYDIKQFVASRSGRPFKWNN